MLEILWGKLDPLRGELDVGIIRSTHHGAVGRGGPCSFSFFGGALKIIDLLIEMKRSSFFLLFTYVFFFEVLF